MKISLFVVTSLVRNSYGEITVLDTGTCVGPTPDDPIGNSWSPKWMNRDSPTVNADNESFLSFGSKMPCLTPTGLRAREVGGDGSMSTMQTVEFSLSTGFICMNADNVGGCKDYEIQVCCPDKLVGKPVDLLWLVDGTGSYKYNMPTASTNFKKQRDFAKSHKVIAGLHYRMSLCFFADKGGPMSTQWTMALPLTDVESITDPMVNSAFALADSMANGGDLPEDVLLGLVFGMTDPAIGWNKEAVRQMQVFTDNPFWHAADNSFGSVDPPLPLSMYSGADPNAMLYKYYQKHDVATMTLGIMFNVDSASAILTSGGPTLIHQLYFNLVQCDPTCVALYSSTFTGITETHLTNWYPGVTWGRKRRSTEFSFPTGITRDVIASATIAESFEAIETLMVDQIEHTLAAFDSIKPTCESDDDCDRKATCDAETTECTCREGYAGDGQFCLEKYELDVVETEALKTLDTLLSLSDGCIQTLIDENEMRNPTNLLRKFAFFDRATRNFLEKYHFIQFVVEKRREAKTMSACECLVHTLESYENFFDTLSKDQVKGRKKELVESRANKTRAILTKRGACTAPQKEY